MLSPRGSRSPVAVRSGLAKPSTHILLVAAFARAFAIPTPSGGTSIEITHQETPSPWTQYGVKGGSEGGRMVSPPALASAVEDALRPFGAKIDEIPVSPERIVELIEAAGGQ